MKVRRRAPELSVRRALRDAKTLVPTDGSLTGLIEAIAREHRRTLIRVEVDLTGSALSGAWIPVDGVDYLLAGRDGVFDAGAWSARQRTTGHQVEVDGPTGRIVADAVGVDPETGALLVAGAGSPTAIDSGDVTRCRVVALPGLARTMPRP